MKWKEFGEITKAVHVVGVLNQVKLLQGERVKALTWLKRNASVILEKNTL